MGTRGYYWLVSMFGLPDEIYMWESAAYKRLSQRIEELERNYADHQYYPCGVHQRLYDDETALMMPILVNRELVGRPQWDREWKLVDRLVRNIQRHIAPGPYLNIGPIVPYYTGIVTAYQSECVVMLPHPVTGETHWRTICRTDQAEEYGLNLRPDSEG